LLSPQSHETGGSLNEAKGPMNRAKVRSGSCFQGSKKARLNGSGAIALDWKQKIPFSSLAFVY